MHIGEKENQKTSKINRQQIYISIYRKEEKNLKKTYVNEDIRFKLVMVIDENGNRLGTLSSDAAYTAALERELDLVCVSPNAPVPVCKIMDYGKYKYTQKKLEKESKKHQVKVEIKEIQLTYTIAEHDMATKARACERFINDNNIVKIVMRLRGRETSLLDAAKEKMQAFVDMNIEYCSIKKDIYNEGRDLIVLLEKKR